MVRYIGNDTDIFCMSNMIGKHVKPDGPLPISFYFGSKCAGGIGIGHGIRVKFCLNPEKYIQSEAYVLELHGDYVCHDHGRTNRRTLHTIREFFRKYKVLFAGAWEEQILEDDITSYLRDRISLHELLEDCYFYQEHKEVLDAIETLEEFEEYVRSANLFNMND